MITLSCFLPNAFELVQQYRSKTGKAQVFNVVARDGVEPPTPAFSELIFPVFPTTSMVAVGLLNTGKYGQHGWIVGDCRG
jgi:predicted AlkP superfamily pyrophosphatase or phosphodiesterase